jgi:hypothetical protein
MQLWMAAICFREVTANSSSPCVTSRADCGVVGVS